METCDFAIAQAISAQCDKPQVPGIRNNAWLINYKDIDMSLLEREGNIITSLALLEGKYAYPVYVPGKTPFTGTQTALTTGTYFNKFTKTASIVVLDSGPDVSQNIIDQLANGEFVFIFENKYKGTEDKNTFEIYGLENGLHATEMNNDKYSEETDGGWAVTLAEEGATKSGLFFFQDDIETTREAIKSMVA